MKPAKAALTALGESTRQDIVALLSKGPLPVHKIAEKFPMSRPAISKHLRILVEANVVECHSIGTRNHYRLKDEGIDALREYLDNLWDVALRRYQILAENSKEGQK